MGFSSLFAACVILLACISQIQASVLSISHLQVRRETQKFKLSITERGTRFYEKVDVNEDEQIAYFNVPAHNGLSATEELFDYRMNITVRRSKTDGACYLKPLPEDLPRPSDLNIGFTQAIDRPTTYQISTVSKKWILSEEVEKTFLRKEVREFCDQYPVYRLEEYTPDSVSVERGRSRRDMRFVTCKGYIPETNCSPQTWQYHCQISDSSCVYYVTCRQVNQRSKTICGDFKHLFHSMVCCNPFCP